MRIWYEIWCTYHQEMICLGQFVLHFRSFCHKIWIFQCQNQKVIPMFVLSLYIFQSKSQWFCTLGVFTTRKTIMIIAKRVDVFCSQTAHPPVRFSVCISSRGVMKWNWKKKEVLCIIFAYVPRLVCTFTKSCRLRNRSDRFSYSFSDEKTYRATQ